MKEQNIYQVGYPKSGNTWLTRLLSDLLNAPAGSGMDQNDGKEIASDLNDQIQQRSKVAPFKVLKTHFLPEEYGMQGNLVRGVYILRDVRDVIISSFFYTHNNIDERHLRTTPFRHRIVNFPTYQINRIKLLSFVKDFCENGFGTGKYGCWGEHLKKWRTYNRKHGGNNITFIKYEDLLADTARVLTGILGNLSLKIPQENDLSKTVQAQSFSSKKKYFQKISESKDIPLGKDFNLQFLRKGTIGDWENFLGDHMLNIIYENEGPTLEKEGYL